MANKSAGKPRRHFSLFHREEGQAALEFVMVLPVFIMFFLLMIDLGMMTYQYVSVSNAVREGARFGTVNCGDGECTVADIENRTIERSGGILTNPLAPLDTVTVSWLDRNADLVKNGQGDSVAVKVNHRYDFLFFFGGVDVVSCSDMRLEQADLNPVLPVEDPC